MMNAGFAARCGDVVALQAKADSVHMDRQTLENEGFTGFRSFSELEIAQIPRVPGIYTVLKPEGFERDFLARSAGGQFKGKDPSLLQPALEKEWIEGAAVLYIGKAGAGSTGTRGLQKRIQELTDFGRGKPVGHWGGRLLWQLAGSQSLVIAWKELAPSEVNSAEAAYQARFVSLYGRLPFANLIQARGTGI